MSLEFPPVNLYHYLFVNHTLPIIPLLISRNLIDLYKLFCLLITPIPEVRRNSTTAVLFRL